MTRCGWERGGGENEGVRERERGGMENWVKERCGLNRAYMLQSTSPLVQGMFVGTVEMGGEKYIGTPALTKPDAQQVAASVANASLPPVCA